jgi:hypothetical protein
MGKLQDLINVSKFLESTAAYKAIIKDGILVRLLTNSHPVEELYKERNSWESSHQTSL